MGIACLRFGNLGGRALVGGGRLGGDTFIEVRVQAWRIKLGPLA